MSNVVQLTPSGHHVVLNKKALALRLGCSTRTIENRMREGMPTLGPDRFGRQRYDLAAVEQWLAAAPATVTLDRMGQLERRVSALEDRLGA
jgi:phage terminase Nu1 subunit (DNA packaging protein)